MTRVDRTIVTFERDGWLAIELHARLFDLTTKERRLVARLTDLIHEFKDAQATELARRAKEATP